jgi:hypothetical protein
MLSLASPARPTRPVDATGVWLVTATTGGTKSICRQRSRSAWSIVVSSAAELSIAASVLSPPPQPTSATHIAASASVSTA